MRAGALQAKRADVRRLFGAGSRLHQIVTWLSGGEGADRGRALIVLDECHKAKNLLDAAGSEPGPFVVPVGQARNSCSAPLTVADTWCGVVLFCFAPPDRRRVMTDTHCTVHCLRLLPSLRPDSSQTGLAVESLQDQLPDACVLYSSATGASEPDNLRYMVRLGSFGYPHIGDMINVLKRWVKMMMMIAPRPRAGGHKVHPSGADCTVPTNHRCVVEVPVVNFMVARARAVLRLTHQLIRFRSAPCPALLIRSGLGALEMFCMGLKATGTYVSRTLSYKGAEFRLDQLDIDPVFKWVGGLGCTPSTENVQRAGGRGWKLCTPSGVKCLWCACVLKLQLL